jgi:hypothetical protein
MKKVQEINIGLKLIHISINLGNFYFFYFNLKLIPLPHFLEIIGHIYHLT